MTRSFISSRNIVIFGMALLMGLSSLLLPLAAQAQSASPLHSSLATAPLDDDDDGDEEWDDDFYGIIQARPAGTAGSWLIGERSFTATSSTRLDSDDGPLTRGACVSVDFEGSRVLEIESEPAHECGRSNMPDYSRGSGSGLSIYRSSVLS